MTTNEKLLITIATFLKKGQVLSKSSDIYNPGHNILELYNVLVQIRFTTSKTKLDI